MIVGCLMPEMQGNEVALSIKRIPPSQPILMVTGYLEKMAASAQPVDGLLGKPFGVDELREAVGTLPAED